MGAYLFGLSSPNGTGALPGNRTPTPLFMNDPGEQEPIEGDPASGQNDQAERGSNEPTEQEKLAKLAEATGPPEIREALKGWTSEELAEAGIV